jgi:hypothetical protein
MEHITFSIATPAACKPPPAEQQLQSMYVLGATHVSAPPRTGCLVLHLSRPCSGPGTIHGARPRPLTVGVSRGCKPHLSPKPAVVEFPDFPAETAVLCRSTQCSRQARTLDVSSTSCTTCGALQRHFGAGRRTAGGRGMQVPSQSSSRPFARGGPHPASGRNSNIPFPEASATVTRNGREYFWCWKR